MKRNILLDIDGVIGNFHTSFAQYLNDEYDAGLDVHEEPAVYSFDQWGPNLSNIDMEEASNGWIVSGGFTRLKPYSGADSFVKQLMEIADVHIVTARIGDFDQRFPAEMKTKIMSDTYDWFDKHGIPTNGEIQFSHKKVDLCKRDNISILIEDKLSTVLEAAQENIHAIIIDRAWNQHPDRFRVYRAPNYDEILNTVRKLST